MPTRSLYRNETLLPKQKGRIDEVTPAQAHIPRSLTSFRDS